LTDNGNRRFTKAWRVPSDPTGEGRDILITYTVYTDSNYTTKADNYGEKFADYRIEHMPKNLGGGGVDVDYKKIRAMVDEVVSTRLKGLPTPEKVDMPNMAFHIQPVLNAIAGLRNDIEAIELPETDFSGVEFRLDTLDKAVKAIKIPKTDLAPVLDAISALQEAIEPYTDQTSQDLSAMLERIKAFFSQDMEEIKRQIAGVNQNLGKMPFLILGQPQKRGDEAQNVDYSQLLND
jgi:hypothetical protein